MAKVFSILAGGEIEISAAEFARRRARRDAALQKPAARTGAGADLLKEVADAFDALQGETLRAQQRATNAEEQVRALRARPPAPEAPANAAAASAGFPSYEMKVVERDANNRAHKILLTPTKPSPGSAVPGPAHVPPPSYEMRVTGRDINNRPQKILLTPAKAAKGVD